VSAAPLPVVINRSGGTAARIGDKLEAQVRQAFDEAGSAVELHLVDGAQIAETIAGLAAPVVAVGGGDGTQGSAAAQLAASGQTLAVLPLGTRNHLARQLDIPLDLPAAAKVAVQSHTQEIDLARCNERVFVNNASIGLYTRFVRARERVSAPKWLGTIPATWFVLRRLRARPLCLLIDGKRQTLKTPLLFIGNNRYSLDRGRVGERESLTDGLLSVFAVERKRPLALVAFAARTLVGRADPERDFAALDDAREVVVEGTGQIEVAFDGEVELIALPLKFAIQPGALSVKVPAPSQK
jgi:diacylglycerol kinase family enzyme